MGERWKSISELNIYVRLWPFPPWADPPPADRALGSALADPLEAEDPPLADRALGRPASGGKNDLVLPTDSS